ncbi:unnamed protein product, partial [Phaeothamnion confervicola]
MGQHSAARGIGELAQRLLPAKFRADRISMQIKSRMQWVGTHAARGRSAGSMEQVFGVAPARLTLLGDSVLYLVVEFRGEPSVTKPARVTLSLPDIESQGSDAVGTAAWALASCALGHHADLFGGPTWSAEDEGDVCESVGIASTATVVSLNLGQLVAFDHLSLLVHEASESGAEDLMQLQYERSQMQALFRRFPC